MTWSESFPESSASMATTLLISLDRHPLLRILRICSFFKLLKLKSALGKGLTDVYFKRSYFVLNPNLGSCFERGRALSTPYSFFSQWFWVYRSLLYPPHTRFFPGWDVCQRVKLDSSLTISKHKEKVNYTNPSEISWDLQSSWVTLSLVFCSGLQLSTF